MNKIGIEIHEVVIKTNTDLKSKYFYTLSNSLLRYLKQDSEIKHNISSRIVKNHSRFIEYKELKTFMNLIGYNCLSNKWLQKEMSTFVISPFIQSYNKEGFVLKTQEEIYTENHHMITTIVLNQDSKYKTFKYNDFVKYSTEFLYGIPQSSKVDKFDKPLGVQPIGQTSISKHLGLTQSRVNQLVQNQKKVYIFAEVPKHEYDRYKHFQKSYCTTISHLGYNEDKTFKNQKYYKLLGTKLMTHLHYKSYVKGTTNKGAKLSRKLTKLSNKKTKVQRNYKLASPKLHSRVQKMGCLIGFKTDYMSNNDLTDTSSFQAENILTYQIVSKTKENAIKKLCTEVRINEMFSDIETLQYQSYNFYNKSLDEKVNLLYKLIGRLYFNKQYKHRTKWLYDNFKVMKMYIHNDISHYVHHKQIIKSNKSL